VKRDRKPKDEGVDVSAWGDHMMAAVIPMGIGAAVGLLVMVGLRALKLHWTWSLLGTLLVWPVWQLEWQLGLAIGTAVTTAAVAGCIWQRDDVERGGSEAREARERLDPARWAWTAAKRKRAGGRRVSKETLEIGLSRRGGTCRVPFGRSRGVHAVVPGATGAGKTVTLAAIAQAYVLAGLPAVVLDPKGDGYLRRVLSDAAWEAGVRFVEWTPTGDTVYNPFGRGGPTEITDKALAGHRWSEPHYELITQRLLGQVLTTMRAAGNWPPTLSTVVAHMDPERLDDLASDVGGDVGDRVSAYVDGLSARAKAELGGGRDRLAVLAESELGPRLDPALGDGPALSFEESVKRGDVVYIHTDADRYPAASKLLGAAVVIDLVTLTADLKDGAMRGLLVIDEFAAVAAEHISRLFGRARSAGLSVLLGTQSLADLRSARPDDPSDTLTEQILTNIEFALVHRQSDPDSAERLAQLAGTTPSWSTTRRINGLPGFTHAGGEEGTRTREREFLVNPDDFKRLQTGEAVVIHPIAKRPAEIVRVWPPKE
jgi:type IV secretory system conjugative DNA transfer VirD4/TraG family protein/helicase HerA-like protein